VWKYNNKVEGYGKIEMTMRSIGLHKSKKSNGSLMLINKSNGSIISSSGKIFLSFLLFSASFLSSAFSYVKNTITSSEN